MCRCTWDGAQASVVLRHWNSHIWLGCWGQGILQRWEIWDLRYWCQCSVADLDVRWVILQFKVLIVQVLSILIPVKVGGHRLLLCSLAAVVFLDGYLFLGWHRCSRARRGWCHHGRARWGGAVVEPSKSSRSVGSSRSTGVGEGKSAIGDSVLSCCHWYS